MYYNSVTDNQFFFLFYNLLLYNSKNFLHLKEIAYTCIICTCITCSDNIIFSASSFCLFCNLNTRYAWLCISGCRPNWVEFKGHCYFYGKLKKVSWFEAKVRYSLINISLICINNSEKNFTIRVLVWEISINLPLKVFNVMHPLFIVYTQVLLLEPN